MSSHPELDIYQSFVSHTLLMKRYMHILVSDSSFRSSPDHAKLYIGDLTGLWKIFTSKLFSTSDFERKSSPLAFTYILNLSYSLETYSSMFQLIIASNNVRKPNLRQIFHQQICRIINHVDVRHLFSTLLVLSEDLAKHNSVKINLKGFRNVNPAAAHLVELL